MKLHRRSSTQKKRSLKDILKPILNVRGLLLFTIVKLVLDSPIIIGYTLAYITKNKWHITYASAVLAFWSTPLIPEIPIAIAITLALQKFIRRKSK